MTQNNKLDSNNGRFQKQLDKFRGVYSLLLTPFEANGSIDWAAYDRYVDWQLSAHPHGLFAVCGSSEMALLSFEERIALAKRAVQLAGSVPVVATANVGSNPDEHNDELLRMVETGISGVVLIVPDGMGGDAERLEQYFHRMAALSPLPVILYECPIAKPREVPAAVYGRLVRDAGIIGIKDTTCTLEAIGAKIAAAPDSIVFQANTPLLLESLRNGCGGVMSIVTTVAAKLVKELWLEVGSGGKLADQILERLVFLDAVLGAEFTASGKYLAAQQGAPMNPLTRSGKQLSAANTKALDVWLKMNATEMGEG